MVDNLSHPLIDLIFYVLGGPDVIERVNLLLHVCVNVYHEARDKIGNVNMLQAVQYGQAMKHKQVTQSDFPHVLLCPTNGVFIGFSGARSAYTI